MSSCRVRTSNGYVGRWSLDTDLVDNCPVGMSYSWPIEQAEQIAARFDGQVEYPSIRRPSCAHRRWSVYWRGTCLALFDRHDTCEDWLDSIGGPESTVRPTRSEVVVVSPEGFIIEQPDNENWILA